MYARIRPLGFQGLGRTFRRGMGASSSGPQYQTPNNLPQVTADGFTIPRVTQNIHFPGDPMNVYRGFPMPGTPINPTLAPIIAQYGGRTSDGTNAIMPVRDDSQPSHVSVVPPPPGTQDYAPGSAAYQQVQDTILAIKAQIAGDAALYSPAYQNIPCPGGLFQQWTVSQGGFQQPDGSQGYYPGTPDDQQSSAGGCSWGWYSTQDPGFLRTGVPNDIRFQAQSPGVSWVQIPKGTPVIKMANLNAYQYQLPGGGSVAQPSLPPPVAPPPPIPAAALPPLPAPVPPPAPVPSPANPITNFFQMISGGGQNSPGTPLAPQFQPQPPATLFTGGSNTPTSSSAGPNLNMVPAVQPVGSANPNRPISAAPASSGFDLSSLTSNPWVLGGIAVVALLMFSQGGKR